MMALEGIRVVDWTIWQAGPVASEMLGDLGAEVIKVEQRGVGDPGRGLATVAGERTRLAGDRNYYFETHNRNKKSISLDLRKPKGREVMHQLVEKSDVFVQNFRQGVAEKYQLDYETLCKVNPRLIYASLTGLGEKGPESHRPTLDPVGLFRSGFAMSVVLPDGEPVQPFGGMTDQVNAWSLAYGVLAALVARERLGIGQKVVSSFLSSMMWLQGGPLGAYLYNGRPLRSERRKRYANALANYYRCADGKWVYIMLQQSERHWSNFCQAAGLAQLENDPRFADMWLRAENYEVLTSILEDVFASKTWAVWKNVFSKFPDFIYEVAQSLVDLVEDPQVIANDYLLDFDHPTIGKMKVVAPPVSLSATPGGVRLPPPEFGQHTEEVLMDVCGYTWEELETLRIEEVI